MDFFSCFPAGTALLWWDWSRVAQTAEGTLPPSAVPTAELTQGLPLSLLPSTQRRAGCPQCRGPGCRPPSGDSQGSPGPPQRRRLCPLPSAFSITHSPWTAASPPCPPRTPPSSGQRSAQPSLPAAPRRCSAVTGAAPRGSRSLQRSGPTPTPLLRVSLLRAASSAS